MHSGTGAGESADGSAPAVTVVIPCYNLGAYVNEAVQSVLDQTYRDFEILLIDDGSTDPVTRHLFASYRRPFTRILRTENQGLARTRNLGIREAAGRYVSFLDADDLFEPTFLERTVPLLEGDPSLAFASCWLAGFGESSFLWTPATCDFPHLLAEDTVCTAALTRKEALVSAGGFDAAMPLPGYEDWDLAIGLVERGLRGRIVPEVLFRYRIRPGSMTASCTAPENHARLVRYIVQKHPEAYERHLVGVLEVIEARTIEIEESRRSRSPVGHPDEERRAAFLEETLHRVLESRSWKASRALRGTSRRVKLWMRRRESAAPRISAVLTCRDQGKDLPDAFRSLSLQISRDDEVVIVDNGSEDPVTLQVLEGYRSAGIPVIRTDRVSDAAARERGLRTARAPYLFAMGSDQTLEADCLPSATEILDGDPSVDFVCPGIRDSDGTGFTYFPESAELPAVLGRVRDASAEGILRVPDRHWLVSYQHLARVRGCDPEKREANVRSARSDEPSKAQDLAGADGERYPGERTLLREVPDLEHHVAQLGRRPPEEVAHRPADHVADRRRRRHFAGRPGGDPAAIAQDRDPIGDLEDILHAMGDEEDRDAFAPQGLDDPEEATRLVSRQRCRRLVHDQDANAQRERLRDLEGLLRRDGETARRRADVEARAEPLEDDRGVAPHRRPVDDPAAVTMADEDVLGDGEVGEDHRLLIHRGDPEGLRLEGASHAHQTSVDMELPGVGLLDAGHDLDERRLPRAVLPEQRVDLARLKLERNIVERLDRAEALRDAPDLEDHPSRSGRSARRSGRASSPGPRGSSLPSPGSLGRRRSGAGRY